MDVLNNYAINLIAEYLLGVDNPLPVLSYHLFEDAVTVTVDSVPSDFTELVAPGYAGILLNPGSWAISVAAGIANATYPDITWTLTGPGSGSGTVYGHYVLDGQSGAILWGQNWPTPFAIPAGGGTITISPSWQDSQCSGASGIALPFRRAGRDPVSHRGRK